MNNPLISIIVPVYKVEQYLDECVQSIVNQTHKNLEIILVDDGSPDGCPKMCDDWAQKDHRIKVIHQVNGGAAVARNAALDVANGDYIGFVDSDDYIVQTMFEDLLVALTESETKMSYCSAYRVMIGGEVQQLTYASDEKKLDAVEAVDAIFYGNIDTAVWSKLFERTVFDDIRFPEGEVNEEFPILIPLVLKAGGMVVTGKTLYYYREREGSVTNSSYLRENNSATIYKNLSRMKKQIEEYKLPCVTGFRFFSASFAYNIALAMEKRFPALSDAVKRDYCIYRRIMFENKILYLFSRYSKLKDKILYLMVLTKLVRPLYKLFYKEHL